MYARDNIQQPFECKSDLAFTGSACAFQFKNVHGSMAAKRSVMPNPRLKPLFLAIYSNDNSSPHTILLDIKLQKLERSTKSRAYFREKQERARARAVEVGSHLAARAAYITHPTLYSFLLTSRVASQSINQSFYLSSLPPTSGAQFNKSKIAPIP